VIKTVLFDIIFSFTLGAFLAYWFKQELKNEARAWFHPYFATGLVFQGFFYIPLGVYLYYFYPAWSWMFFFDPLSVDRLSLALLGIIALSGYLLFYIFGFQLGQFLIKRNKPKALMKILILALVILCVFSLLTINRLLWVGEYQDWHNGIADFILNKPLGWMIILMAILGFGSLAMVLKKLHGQNFSPLA